MDCIDLFKKAAAALQTDPRYLELDAVAVKPDGGVVRFTVSLGAMTDAERRILADGCLINYYKNN